MLVHALYVLVYYKERNIVALILINILVFTKYLDWLPSQNNEVLSSLHQEASEFMAQNLLNFITLLDSNAII